MTRTQPDATALDGIVSQVLAASEAAGMTVIPAVPDTDRDDSRPRSRTCPSSTKVTARG
jgi:hypothetical protein